MPTEFAGLCQGMAASLIYVLPWLGSAVVCTTCVTLWKNLSFMEALEVAGEKIAQYNQGSTEINAI